MLHKHKDHTVTEVRLFHFHCLLLLTTYKKFGEILYLTIDFTGQHIDISGAQWSKATILRIPLTKFITALWRKWTFSTGTNGMESPTL